MLEPAGRAGPLGETDTILGVHVGKLKAFRGTSVPQDAERSWKGSRRGEIEKPLNWVRRGAEMR